MKYSLSVFFITLSFISVHQKAHAAAVAGALEPTQILNNIELIGVNISDAATALNTQLLEIQDVILDPLGDSLIALSQLQTANSIISLVNGGGGGNSLIPGDPRRYVDLKGLAAVKISLGALSSGNGAYSNTLFGSLTQNFRDIPFTTKISQISQSSIPRAIQDTACSDETLSSLAQEDVAVEGQPLDQAAYTARKAYFYEQFCGNSATDPATAQALDQLSTARPGVAMWDKWLLTTVGGDNEYTKSVQLNEAVAEEARRREEEADNDLDRGRGVTSQTDCLVSAPSDENGDPYDDPEDAPCITDVVLNPSGLLQDSLTKAANAGLDRLGSIQGWGALVTTLTSIQQLSNGIRSAVGGMTGGASGGSSTGNNNTSNSNTVTTAPVNDLANDPAKKATVVDPIISLLNVDSQVLIDLQDVDQSILADLGVYESRLNEVKACYAEVDPQNGAANSLFNNRDNVIATLRAKVADDSTKISSATTQIQALRTTLQTSQSTTQIMDAFFAYQNTAQNRPSYTTLGQRKADYTQNKSLASSDTGSNGELTRLYNTCVNMRNQMNQ